MPPSWMMLEITSFGTLSSLYSYLKPTNGKRDIARYFGLADSVLSSWLHSMVYLRNICAHHARLWNREMQIQPIIPRHPHRPFLTCTHFISPATGLPSPLNNKAYFILSMVIYLMDTINPKHSLQHKFLTLLAKYPNIDTQAMGFPPTWQNEPLWR